MFRPLLHYLLYSNTIHLLYNIHMHIHLNILHYTFSDMFRPWLSHYQGKKIQGVTHDIWLYIYVIRAYLMYFYMYVQSTVAQVTNLFNLYLEPPYLACGGVHDFHSLMKIYTYITCQIPWILPPRWWFNQGRNMSEKV